MTTYIKEILEQPDALRRTAEADNPYDQAAAAIQNRTFRRAVLTGMGSSHHSTIPLWLRLNAALKLPIERWEASELAHYGVGSIDNETLLIAVSQSGESAEVVRLIEEGVQPGLSISVTNGADNTLANWADVPLLTHAGDEATVSTKTYTTTLAALDLLGRALTGTDLVSARQGIIDLAKQLRVYLSGWEGVVNQIAGFATDVETIAFIARGGSMASANTAALDHHRSLEGLLQRLHGRGVPARAD